MLYSMKTSSRSTVQIELDTSKAWNAWRGGGAEAGGRQ